MRLDDRWGIRVFQASDVGMVSKAPVVSLGSNPLSR